ncbi:GrpB family protein [Cupriavidus nantongensis]|uniref:GrpB family protein n=1 Tax=Cupriavidus nantongensis TaxID=1796606 RepID=UPI002245FA83|nr:GrpB family protein [Cupriavidus nantongensis]
MSEDGAELLRLDPSELSGVAAERLFRALRRRLAAVLPTDAVIEHVGATSVSGCLTKGDLDICVQVSEETFAEADRVLGALYERNLGSVRTAGFSAFKHDELRPPVGIQLVARGAPLDVFVRFRDCLRADPVLVDHYNALKRTYDGAAMSDYRAAKSAFIEQVLGAAGQVRPSQ